MTSLTHLECSQCGKTYDAGTLQQACSCGETLLARYDLAKTRQAWNRAWIPNGPSTMWRYQPVLPLRRPESMVTLGEGYTPLLRSRRLAGRLGANQLWIKDDSLNPTASFKARGMSCAVSMAVELGARTLAVPSAGNAAAALAAYAAAAGVEAHVFMPADVPRVNYIACRSRGAHVTLVDGLICDCARVAAERASAEGWFNLTTFREPYRLEGAKTLGYELAEQFHWNLPDVVVYPTGAGIGLVAMWKAFDEMEQLGFILKKRPRLIAVQAAGCQPFVRAIEEGAERCRFWENAYTIASGLRIPRSAADYLVLRAIRASGGTAVAVSDSEMLDAGVEMASTEGLFAAPEGAACVAALRKLLGNGTLSPDDRAVICSTGSGMKYLEAYSTRFPVPSTSQQDKLGGLITPR